MINYFDTKKETEDYLVEIGIRNYKLFLGIIYNLIYDNKYEIVESKNRKISYEQYELLEEKYPEIVKIDNFFDKINKVNYYNDFVKIFEEDIIKIVLNNKEYHDSVLKYILSEKNNFKYEIYEKPGKLFF